MTKDEELKLVGLQMAIEDVLMKYITPNKKAFSVTDEVLELIKKAFIEEEPKEETDNTMKVYEVHYISGRNARYSVTRVKAANKEDAISKVFEMEGEAFENRLVLTKIIEEVK